MTELEAWSKLYGDWKYVWHYVSVVNRTNRFWAINWYKKFVGK